MVALLVRYQGRGKSGRKDVEGRVPDEPIQKNSGRKVQNLGYYISSPVGGVDNLFTPQCRTTVDDGGRVRSGSVSINSDDRDIDTVREPEHFCGHICSESEAIVTIAVKPLVWTMRPCFG